MYLKKLELQGFKSFADKTVLEIFPGITGVIGPNGSGKSNIADSIRWVLGEQSIKELRGGKTVDVIFSGTQNRKSLGFAEATLVFDNSDNKLPIEYQEVTITRRLYRSGETGYYINKAQCRLKDILELFMDTGIGRDGYSIIGQGKIDEILSNKSEDRRNVFEEAAGIVKYKTRKEESEKKLESTKLNLLRINDIMKEIEGNLNPLKNQADKAKKFIYLKNELKNVEVGLFIYNIEKQKNDLKKIEEDMDVINFNLNLEEGKLEKIKITKEELKSNIEEMNQNIEKMQTIIFSSKKNIEELNSTISINMAKIQNSDENKTRVKDEINEITKKINEKKEEIKNKIAKNNNLILNKEKFVKELDEKQKIIDEISKSLSKEEMEIEKNKSIIEENLDFKYGINSKISEKNANIVSLNKRKIQLESEIKNNISEIDKNRFAKEDIEKTFYKIQKEKNSILEKSNNINLQKDKIEQAIKSMEILINNNLKELNFKESKYKFLIETEKEKEGYQKSVKAILKECEKNDELGSGVEGALVELIDVPEKYETSIDILLGSILQNIVTKDENDAKRLIEYLRKNNLGRASFLPISTIRGKKIENIKGEKTGVLGIASDLIKYNKKYEQIIENLLGRTVIVENMDIAIKLAKQNSYSFRIATLNGDIINSSGAISGGSVSKKNNNILGRNKEIQNLALEIENIKRQQEKSKNELNELKNSYNNMLLEIKEIENIKQEIEIKYNVEKQKVEAIEENILKISKQIEQNKTEKKDLDIELENNLKELEENKLKDKEIENQNEKLKKIINEFLNSNKDKQKEIDNLNLDITNLKISVSSFEESENSINEMIKILQEEINSQEENLIKKKKLIENAEIDLVTASENIEKARDKQKRIEKELNNIDIEKIKLDKEKLQEKLKKNEIEENDEIKLLQELKTHILKLEVKKSRFEEDLNTVITNLWNEYQLTPNNADKFEKVQNVSYAEKNVNELKQDIRDLGNVNLDSIEEYQNLKQRYDFISEQRIDLENTIIKLKDIIHGITESMKKIFKEKIEIINKNFEETFKELFGGGEARIIIEDENNILECGIDIEVQPPGKKLQSMGLLSGGERAFTAIALLFAILKMSPAPFCVLDEIEAALDDVNVTRYAEFLKKFAKGTQFLVITHRKGTMEVADTVYGVTMEEKGISKLLSMKLKADV